MPAGGLMRGNFPKIAVVLALALAVTGCAQATSDVSAVMQSPITPIVLHVARDGLITVAEDSGNPVVGGIAILGVAGIDLIDSKLRQARASAPGDTLLVVRQTAHGQVKATIFKITTGRELQVAMNGKFIAEITPHEITITAEPGTGSTIVITDVNAGERVYRSGKLQLQHYRSQADLDTGTDKNIPAGKAEIEEGFSTRLVTLDNTTGAPWTAGGQPSLATCASLPRQQWGTVLVGYRMTKVPAGTTWCVHTSQGRYGVIIMGASLLYDDFSYVLWKKPGDR